MYCCSIVYFCNTVLGHLCILRSRPDHVLVGVGSSANFTCQSTTPKGITWKLTPLGRTSLMLNDSVILSSGTSVSVSYSADQKTSTVVLRDVQKQDTGTIACADDQEKSFAELTILGE